MRSSVLLLTLVFCVAIIPSPQAQDLPKQKKNLSKQVVKKPAIKRLYSGRVVLLREALKKRGVSAFSEHQGQVALETAEGKLIPIIADWRGRAFFQDKRLRNRPVELIGYQQSGVPFLQVLTIYTFDKQHNRNYTDYWCDICAIPMYEIKPCDCCQGEIELRFQKQKLPKWLSIPKSTLPEKP